VIDWFNFREPASAWTHFIGLLLAFPGTWFLWRRSRGDRLKQIGMLVFGLGLVMCYGGSWSFHAVRLSDRAIQRFNTLDHIGIYVLIAGTFTPICLVILRGAWRLYLMLLIWLLALGGIALCLTPLHMPIAVSTILYLFMGWVGCLTYFELSSRLSHAAVRPVWIGGVLYSIGAILNVWGHPVIVPGVFEAHEVFHLFVMAGSLSHYWFMFRVVAPYQRLTPDAASWERQSPDWQPCKRQSEDRHSQEATHRG
jgi:hemolysin III